MKDAGIFDGDVVVIERQSTAEIGDIVVAIVDNEFTLKRLAQDSENRLYLHPENEEFKDIYPQEGLAIYGVMTGLMSKSKKREHFLLLNLVKECRDKALTIKLLIGEICITNG